MNDLSFEFNSPMTKEDWDKLQDNEMEDTEEVTFKTPSGKRVTFRKVKYGTWKVGKVGLVCSECRYIGALNHTFCPHCGADMRERNDNDK